MTAAVFRITVGHTKMAARAYTKAARAAAEEATRTALLDAAEEAFFDPGWDRATLASIAARAGVTKQTLLRHFGSKDGLLEAAFARAFERVRAQRFAAPGDDVEAAIDTLLEHYAEFGERSLRMGALAGTGRAGEIVRAARALHRAWVDHAFAQPLARVPARERDRVRNALVAACDVTTWAVLARDLALPPGEVRATLLRIVRGLLG